MRIELETKVRGSVRGERAEEIGRGGQGTVSKQEESKLEVGGW